MALWHLKHTKGGWLTRADRRVCFMVDHERVYQFYINAAFSTSGLAQQIDAADRGRAGPWLKWLRPVRSAYPRAARFYEGPCGWCRRAAQSPYEVETGEGPLQISTSGGMKNGSRPVNQAERLIVADPIIFSNVDVALTYDFRRPRRAKFEFLYLCRSRFFGHKLLKINPFGRL